MMDASLDAYLILVLEHSELGVANFSAWLVKISRTSSYSTLSVHLHHTPDIVLLSAEVLK